MSDADAPGAPLADALAALASETRLALLRELRVPRALREIEVASRDGGDRGHPLSRQAVRLHLDRLLDLGIVLARPAERAYGATTEYVVNHQRLFALSEEFRGLARLRPLEEPELPTALGDGPAPPSRSGACLAVVKGLDEGRLFPLAPPAPEGGWVVGRRRGADVPLDFDPFVSAENSVVEWRDGRHAVRDLPGSRNGTTLNFRRLPKGGAAPLRHGDLLGVGRTFLLFWA